MGIEAAHSRSSVTALPLYSSRQVLKALRKAGFVKARKSAGSHQSMTKKREVGGYLTVVVPLNRKEIPRGTLRGILDQAQITEEELRRLAD